MISRPPPPVSVDIRVSGNKIIPSPTLDLSLMGDPEAIACVAVFISICASVDDV